jgi:hypothetical protein
MLLVLQMVEWSWTVRWLRRQHQPLLVLLLLQGLLVLLLLVLPCCW